MPVRYSSIVWWDDGLHTNRKCPPAPPRRSAGGRTGRRPDRWASAGHGAPASRPAFAVLLLVPIPRHDELRLQRHNAVVIGRHERRRPHPVEVLGPVLAPLRGRALLTMDLARHVILGAVQSDQHVAAKLPESL